MSVEPIRAQALKTMCKCDEQVKRTTTPLSLLLQALASMNKSEDTNQQKLQWNVLPNTQSKLCKIMYDKLA